ncbi:hypothetical protein HMPREF0731_2747, partial [Pseudoroseomonas cervicalis ATCC 49957]
GRAAGGASAPGREGSTTMVTLRASRFGVRLAKPGLRASARMRSRSIPWPTESSSATSRARRAASWVLVVCPPSRTAWPRTQMLRPGSALARAAAAATGVRAASFGRALPWAKRTSNTSSSSRSAPMQLNWRGWASAAPAGSSRGRSSRRDFFMRR